MTGSVSTICPLPPLVVSLVEASFDEELYASAIASLTSYYAASAATCESYMIPPPTHLASLFTMLVHPSTADTPLRLSASQLLSRVLDVASNPRDARLDEVWKFSRKRRYRDVDSDDGEDHNGLQNESLFSVAESVWDIIEWAFYKGERGWMDLLNHVVRMLRNDLEQYKAGIGFDANYRKEAIEHSMLAQWLRDSGNKASFNKAIRAIFATRGGQMMLDRPKGIYESSSAIEPRFSITGDIWDGSILLSHRIELISMIYELSGLNSAFFDRESFLDALLRRLLPLDYKSLSSFVSNIVSIDFRTALCELIALRLSSEAVKLIKRLGSDKDSTPRSRLLKGYLCSLPLTGREGAGDLAKYCIITGHLFRAWALHTNREERHDGLIDAIDDAIQRRDDRLQSLKPSAREEVEDVVRRENCILKLLVLKLERGI